MTTLFLDGAYGTVGQNIQPYLSELQAAGHISRVLTLDQAHYRSEEARIDAMKSADLIVCCLPDQEAPNAVALAQNVAPKAKLLDASAAFRCDERWTYGLPEVVGADAIQSAKYVANPGCLATGCILMAKPIASLMDWHGLDAAWLSFVGVTGYTAMGAKGKPGDSGITAVQLGKSHRHLPEIQKYGKVYPALSVMVGNWPRGMLVQTTVRELDADVVFAAYQHAYEGSNDIQVRMATEHDDRLSATEFLHSNHVGLTVAKLPEGGTTIYASYDNLGKGSAAAAAANIRLMLSPRKG